MPAGFRGNCIELRENGNSWFSLAFDSPEQVKLNDGKVTVVYVNSTANKWTGSAVSHFQGSVRFRVKKMATALADDVSPEHSVPWGPGDLIMVEITITLTNEPPAIILLPAVVDAPNL